MVEQSELQSAFWHALLAPFHDHELSEVTGRGPKALTYVDKRAIENRLDTVCGPDGWYPRYKSAEAGLIICSLSIFVPGPYAKLPASDSAGSPKMPGASVATSTEKGCPAGSIRTTLRSIQSRSRPSEIHLRRTG